MNDIIIIGAGAAGLMAALHAKTPTNKVIILEKNSMCGKKILATGNGKCNYYNSDQTLTHYNSTNKELLKDIITEQNTQSVLKYFDYLGIFPKIKNGYYYPFSNQATTIRDALVREAVSKGIVIKYDFDVFKLEKQDNEFIIYSANEIVKAHKVILSTGSKAAPKTGSTGTGYQILKKFNHTIIEPLPALVQLKTQGKYLKEWAGVRTDVDVSLYENNIFIKRETGEIQLTDYGVSGICIFNLSRHVSLGLSINKKEQVKINFLPFFENPSLDLANYFKDKPKRPLRIELSSILNSKLVDVILTEASLITNSSFQDLQQDQKDKLISYLTNFTVDVVGTNSFEHSQVCSGGLPLTEVNINTFESTIVKNLYIVGELLDVDGDCGGYNLTFAWLTGMLAGKDATNND